MRQKERVLIIGAGPAGLGAAYELYHYPNAEKKEFDLHILERNDCVGGLSRTNAYKGYRFDIGPHRFFTKNKDVMGAWKSLMGDDFVEHPRYTRIFSNSVFYQYPLELKDLRQKLGFWKMLYAYLMYLKAQVMMPEVDLSTSTFEEFVTKHYGSYLYKKFFKYHTEKVWGVPCTEIGAKWAAQRVKTALFSSKKATSPAKSLVSRFWYPKLGAQFAYEKMVAYAKSQGAQLTLSAEVTAVHHQDGMVTSVEYTDGHGNVHQEEADFLFTSMPITYFVNRLIPAAPQEILQASKNIRYRDHLCVHFIVNKEEITPDHWIYVHSPNIMASRLANYTNFSKQMIGKEGTSALSVEYHLFKTDQLWKLTDDELIKFATDELVKMGLCQREEILEGFVTREPDSYPIFYLGTEDNFNVLKNYVSKFTNVSPVGRAGMFKYTNMDASQYTGMLAARNYLHGRYAYDVWAVNDDAEYQEEIREGEASVLQKMRQAPSEAEVGAPLEGNPK